MEVEAVAKARPVKRDCQNADFPDFSKYADVVQRLHMKLDQQLR